MHSVLAWPGHWQEQARGWSAVINIQCLTTRSHQEDLIVSLKLHFIKSLRSLGHYYGINPSRCFVVWKLLDKIWRISNLFGVFDYQYHYHNIGWPIVGPVTKQGTGSIMYHCYQAPDWSAQVTWLSRRLLLAGEEGRQAGLWARFRWKEAIIGLTHALRSEEIQENYRGSDLLS